MDTGNAGSELEIFMIGILVFLGHVAALFFSVGGVVWLVIHWPKAGFSLDEKNPVKGWRVLRNILAVPASAYMFYHFTLYQTAQGLGPWPMMEPDKGFYSFGLAGAAVRSVGAFMAFLWTVPTDFLLAHDGVYKTISQNGTNEIPAFAATIALGILLIVLAITILTLLGEALFVIAVVGGGVLVVAPVVAQIVMLGVVAIMVLIGMFFVAYLFTGGRVLDDAR